MSIELIDSLSSKKIKMEFRKYILAFILVLAISQLSLAQCYDISISSGVFADSPMTVGAATEVTYEICNNADPIPFDPNGGLRINICPAVNNLLQVSTFTGTALSHFTMASFVNCSIAEQINTIPTGCFTFIVSYEPKSESEIGEYTGDGENTGVHCIRTNIVPSGIVAGNACNVITNDDHTMCNYSVPETVLSVDLETFSVTRNARFAQLHWSTSNEINNAYFDVEHAIDGVNFRKIATIEGNGTTTETTKYSFTDKTPANGINYYRLTQFNINGISSYSEVKNIDFSTHRSIRVLPNPATEFVRIEGVENGTVLQVIDISGKEVLKTSVNVEIDVALSQLYSGTYLIKLIDIKGKLIHTQKLIITQ